MPFRSRTVSETGLGAGVKAFLAAAAALILAVSSPPSARGESVMVLNSKNDVGPYQLAVKGFRLVYRDLFFVINLDEQKIPSASRQADVVVAIGSAALEAATAQPSTAPLVFLMTLKPPDPASLKGRSYVGIETLVSLTEYLTFISKKFPQLKSVGLMTSDRRTAEEARRSTAPIRVELAEVRPSDRIPEVAADLLSRAGGLLLRPDARVDSKEVADAVLAQCREAGKPVFAFSEALVKQGALVALVAPYTEMGMQAARIAKKSPTYLRSRSEMIPPDHTVIYLNRKTADGLKIPLPEALLQQAEKVE